MSFTCFYLDGLDALGRFARTIHAQQLSILSRLVPTLPLVEDSHTVKWFSPITGWAMSFCARLKNCRQRLNQSSRLTDSAIRKALS
jgi:hypothetical protein